MANIKPLEDKVLVQIVEAETTTASGLVIPDSAKEKPQEATVVAVAGRTNDKGEVVPVGVNEGDTVIFSKYGGTELKYDGQEYLLLSARDLLAVIEK
ncbi:co-chaperone GroES [Corynebacterium guaraldiae]|uniref:Co-chaperonin GroES n=1 Tax=Corynebacterium guaraldiae TaxID=3051103 RepID=A0ABY3CX07_9CORY|nr:co-chaperone GroES [Corynebacterium guaraldiae]